MKLRRFLFPFTKLVVRSNTKLSCGRSVIVDSRPKLVKGENYIFASTHYFTEDIESVIGTLDRNAWVLIGTTDQIENNFKMYGAWLNGMIYVDRENNESRKDSLKKMKYILDNGSSVLLFPEGGWNNTENSLTLNPFSGAYYLSCDCSKKIVPVSSIRSEIDNNIHVVYGEPLDLSIYKANENDSLFLKNIKKVAANTLLRDSMSSLIYDLLEKYTIPVEREKMQGDIRLKYCDDRLREYMKNTWSSKECIKSEFVQYKPKIMVNPSEVLELIEKTNEFENKLLNILDDCVLKNIISSDEKKEIFKRLKFSKNPMEAIEFVNKIQNNDKSLNYLDIEVSNVEPFFSNYEFTNIVSKDEVFSFVDDVNVSKNNAYVLSDTIASRKNDLIDREKYDLSNYVDMNYDSIKKESKRVK